MRRLGLLLLLGGALCACTRPKPAPVPEGGYAPATGLAGCLLYTDPQQSGTTPSVLPELSGLARASRDYGGEPVFWAHNDSGNAFELFALTAAGDVRATFTLTGAEPRDVEDIAVGPCGPPPAGSCLWLADIGDNFRRRDQVRLYRVPEPELLSDATLAVEALPFTYPNGSHDAEALVVDAQGRPAVVTKQRGSLGQVFVLEGLGPERVTQARPLGTLEAPGEVDQATTAADLHPSGERLLLRTYTRLWEVRAPGARGLEALVKASQAQARGELRDTVVMVPAPAQPQSEAVAYLDEGRGYLVGTEFSGQPLFRTDCLGSTVSAPAP